MDADELERQHFLKTIAVFKFYRSHAFKKLKAQLSKYETLSEKQKNLIPDYPNYMERVQSCIEANANFLSNILGNAKPDIFEGTHYLSNQSDAISDVVRNGDRKERPRFGITTSDIDKVHSVLKQFARDWSSVGAKERKESYEPVLSEIKSLYLSLDRQLSEIRILVPGAGLGRLAWELADCGFSCQGNEWSLYMLLPAYFVLNTCKKVNEFTLHPWITQYCNNMSRENQMASVCIPDVIPTDLSPDVPFSMVAGDFLEVYTEPASWDCVATVYFIDTAHNILDYLETIWKILVPGGYWINFVKHLALSLMVLLLFFFVYRSIRFELPGPLLYHFADMPGQDSIELSYAELKKAIQLIGFEVIKEKQSINSTFTQDPNSMLQYQYKCVLTVLRKPIETQQD